MIKSVKNVSEHDEFVPTSKKKLTDEDRKTFELRNKEKSANKSYHDVQMLIDDVNTDKHKGNKHRD